MRRILRSADGRREPRSKDIEELLVVDHLRDARTQFRPVGTSIGIFEYRGQYYFDSFFDIWGDFADQRRDMPSLANTLGVFERHDGATRQICEYQVDGQDYPTSKTWEVLP